MRIYRYYPKHSYSCYTDNITEIFDIIKDSEVGEVWTIQIVEMSKEYYEALPEFVGF